jgi:cell division protein FtsI/penicillin-binding protein 2
MVSFGGLGFFHMFRPVNPISKKIAKKLNLSNKYAKISQAQSILIKKGDLNDQIEFENKNYQVKFTFNEELKSYINKLLRQYSSDYSTVVVIDNNTGSILSLNSFSRIKDRDVDEMIFSNQNPAASLFKIITAATLLEERKVTMNSVYSFSGRSTTLYRNQLGNRKNYWNRHQDFETAFAKSNNVVFGKAAINNISAVQLSEMAEKFGFNKPVLQDLEIEQSKLFCPEDQYTLAEMASGFNTGTLISPIHAAALASIVANDGLYVTPKLVESYKELNTDSIYYSDMEFNPERVFSSRTANQLSRLMNATVSEGTARGSFRKMNRALFNKLNLGGKTGSITGGTPFGKRDWFTAFAKPQDSSLGNGISIAVMNVNTNHWYIKSSYLAKNIIEFYYSNIYPLNKNLTKTVRKKKSEEV